MHIELDWFNLRFSERIRLGQNKFIVCLELPPASLKYTPLINFYQLKIKNLCYVDFILKITNFELSKHLYKKKSPSLPPSWAWKFPGGNSK